MSQVLTVKKVRRERRRRHVRRRIFGTPERPRLTVQRTLRHIYAQVVDDTRGVTLAMVTSVNFPFVAEGDKKLTKTKQAQLIGHAIAARALASGISQVVFDRNHNLYHGRVKAVADAARKGGLTF